MKKLKTWQIVLLVIFYPIGICVWIYRVWKKNKLKQDAAAAAAARREAKEREDAARLEAWRAERAAREALKFKVVGVTFKNEDGKSRQTLLRKLHFGDVPFNSDEGVDITIERGAYQGEPAFSVFAEGHQVGNISKDDVPFFVRRWSDFVGVTSAEVYGGGTDDEGDDSFTRRIHYAPSIFSIAGPADAYEYFAESWRTDVSGTKIICEEGYTIHIYFLMDGGRLPTEEECRGMEDYFTTVKKPMGDLVLCHAPQEVPYDINLTYYIASSNTKNAVTIQENVKKAVQAYETWQRKIGRDIDPAELIMRVREAGAKRPKLTGPVDTKVTETQVAKLNSKKITYGGIEDD